MPFSPGVTVISAGNWGPSGLRRRRWFVERDVAGLDGCAEPGVPDDRLLVEPTGDDDDDAVDMGDVLDGSPSSDGSVTPHWA